jgi:LysM repeat protein
MGMRPSRQPVSGPTPPAMDDYQTAERSYPSPATQRRTGEIWKARLGLGFVVALTLVSAAVLFRLAGLGVAAAISPFQAAPTSTPMGGIRTTAGAVTPTGLPTTGVASTPSPQTPSPRQSVASTPAASGQPTTGQPAPTVVTPTKAPVPTSTVATSGNREHVVASGDTLGAIATKYGTNVDTLVRLNDFKDKNQTLNIGQKVKLP